MRLKMMIRRNETISIIIMLALAVSVVLAGVSFTQPAYAAGNAGSVSASGVGNIKKGNKITVVFTRKVPSGTSIYSLSGKLKWDTKILKIKTIEGTGGVAPITEETLKDANADLKNTSPKSVTFSIVGSASETDTKVTFEVLQAKDTSVTWTLKEKGSGKVQANAGPGDYEKGGVPVSDISGLSSDGAVTAQVSTGEVKNGTNDSGTGSSSGNSSSGSSDNNGSGSNSSANSSGSNNSGQTATGSTDSGSGYSVGNENSGGNIFSKAAQGDGKSIGILAVIAAAIIAAAIIILLRRRAHKSKV